VQKLVLKSWIDTYSNIFSFYDIEKSHKEYYNDQKLYEYFHERIGIIALNKNNTIGYLIAQEKKGQNKFYINSIHLLKKYHGYGIGKKLLYEARQKAAELNYDKIWLDVMTKNERTVKWYFEQKFVLYDTSSYKMGDSEVEIMILYKAI
jgi:ribosomal protein S18 acetylase RimI-like enzyme